MKHVKVTVEYIDSENNVEKTESFKLKDFSLTSNSTPFIKSDGDCFDIVRSPYAVICMKGFVIVSEEAAEEWRLRLPNLRELEGGF